MPGLDRLGLPDCADAAVGIYFPTTGPETTAPQGRTYTVRHCDSTTNQITVDFVLHGRGVGTDWLSQAAPGDRVTLAHPNSWYRPSSASDFQLLVADLAGLPALARIVDELSPESRAVAIVEVIDRSDLDYLPARPNVSVVNSVGTGNGVAESVLAELVADQHCSDDRSYGWVGAEASQTRAIRKYLRTERGWGPEQLDVLGYWRRHSEHWDARYEQVGPELFAVYQRALAEGKTEKAAREEFDAALERAGL